MKHLDEFLEQTFRTLSNKKTLLQYPIKIGDKTTSLETKINLNYAQTCVSFRAVNTFSFDYERPTVKAVTILTYSPFVLRTIQNT